MIELSESAQWFCAVTNPNCQRRAEMELATLGFRTFLPKVKKWVSHARIKTVVERPLLGRYLFVEVDHPRQSFGAVRRVNGIEGMISNQGAPVQIPRHWVEGFLKRYLAGEWDFVSNAPFAIGMRIKIMEGEFAEMRATVTKVRGHKIAFKLAGINRYGTTPDFNARAA